MTHHDQFIKRCFQLARMAGKSTQTNPMVGAVLVFENTIIGEGYHTYFGGKHAEVEAISSVKIEHKKHIPSSTLYISLEPCNFQGKTPPCTDLILQSGIRKVVISNSDPNPLVNGNGIAKLRNAGIDVEVGILKEEGKDLLRKFKANLNHEPYIILKWAQSIDGVMGHKAKQIPISEPNTKILTHKWRSEVDGILVGKNTVHIDQPALTTRAYKGDNPIPIFLNAMKNDLLKYQGGDYEKIILISEDKVSTSPYINSIQINDRYNIKELKQILFEHKIYSIIVEGGKKVIQQFIEQDQWHEARIIVHGEKSAIVDEDKVISPLVQGKVGEKIDLGKDVVYIIKSDN